MVTTQPLRTAPPSLCQDDMSIPVANQDSQDNPDSPASRVRPDSPEAFAECQIRSEDLIRSGPEASEVFCPHQLPAVEVEEIHQ